MADEIEAKLAEMTRAHDKLLEQLTEKIVYVHDLIKERKGLYGHLEWIANQECRMEAEGSSDDTECCETGACITEWCLSCYARAALDPQTQEK